MKRSKKRLRSEHGQANVEYAVVMAGVIALLIAFGAIGSFLENGTIITHALQSASHAIENVCTGSIKDVMSF